MLSSNRVSRTKSHKKHWDEDYVPSKKRGHKVARKSFLMEEDFSYRAVENKFQD